VNSCILVASASRETSEAVCWFFGRASDYLAGLWQNDPANAWLLPLLVGSSIVLVVYARVFGALGLILKLTVLSAGAAFALALNNVLPNWLSFAALDHRSFVQQFVVALLVVHWLIFLPRFFLGITARIGSGTGMDVGNSHALLPSQAKTVERLLATAGGVPYEPKPTAADRRRIPRPKEGRLMTLDASWGSGKTFILRKFQDYADIRHQRRPRQKRPHDFHLVVSYFNAWSHQASRDPEFAIVEHLIADARVVWPYGWLVLPAWQIILERLLRLFSRGSGFSVDMAWVKLEGGGGVPPPPVRWSGLIARLAEVTFLRSEGRFGATLVLIVDDVDRCAPTVAQRYVTLFRRGLDLPNLTILFPYAAEQLRYKVFDPISVDLPDLGSSMEAAYRGLLSSVSRTPFEANSAGSIEDILDREADGFLKLIDKRIDSGSPSSSAPGGEKGTSDAGWSKALNQWELIRRELLNMSEAELKLGETTSSNFHEKFMRQLESKYGADERTPVPRLSFADAVQIIIGSRPMQKALFPKGPDDEDFSAMIEALETLQEGWLRQFEERNESKADQSEMSDAAKDFQGKLTGSSFMLRRRKKDIEALSQRQVSIRALIASILRDLAAEPVSRSLATYAESTHGTTHSRNALIDLLDQLFLRSYDYMIESDTNG
jgi:KAP family P-loop domain